ncbi:MAG: hypothetical protein AAFU85_15385 [Planctomycetota bacterium]
MKREGLEHHSAADGSTFNRTAAIQEINLVEDAISRRFTLDRKASRRSSVLVRHSSGSRLIIGKSTSGGYDNFNAKGDDSGTIIDLVHALDAKRMGMHVEHLAVISQDRAWVSTPTECRPPNLGDRETLSKSHGNRKGSANPITTPESSHERMGDRDRFRILWAPFESIGPDFFRLRS